MVLACWRTRSSIHATFPRDGFVGGALARVCSGLAICRYDNDAEGFYLFSCDQAWVTITDTWHATIDDAKAQAEFEHAGTKDTWIHWES